MGSAVNSGKFLLAYTAWASTAFGQGELLVAGGKLQRRTVARGSHGVVSAAVWFVCEGAVCLEVWEQDSVSKMWMAVCYLLLFLYDRSLCRNRRGLLTGLTTDLSVHACSGKDS